MDEDVMGGAHGTYATKINAYRILVGSSDGKRPLGKPRRKSEETLKWMLHEQDGRAQHWDTFWALL
jgi:hypothetical protein